MTYKICPRCGRGTDDPATMFGRNKREKDGYSTYCSTCKREISRAWAAAHPEKIKLKSLARSDASLRVKAKTPIPADLQDMF